MARSVLLGFAAVMLVAECAQPAMAQQVGYLDRIELPATLPGGLSGLEITETGNRLFAIGDRGQIVTARVERDAEGMLGLSDLRVWPLRNPDGKEVHGLSADAEGLALAEDGTLFVSFEGRGRVWRYAEPGGPATYLPRHPDFDRLQTNSGLEALAVDARGRLYTLPERSGALTRPFPVYRLAGGTWDQPFSVPRRGGFLPVGADIGPDGRFYLLERAFNGFSFRSRVRRFDLGETHLSGVVTLLETPLFARGNLEGLSVWRDGSGVLRLTMVADDNDNALQRRELVEYRVTE